MNTITAQIKGHGTYSASSLAVDVMISRHLPASPAMLRNLVAEETGIADWSDVDSVTDLLVVLADLYEASLAAKAPARNAPPANASAAQLLKMSKAELKAYGDTSHYRSLIALWNRMSSWEYENGEGHWV